MHLAGPIVALVLCVTLVHCEAQITFSAGWHAGGGPGSINNGGAGKRAASSIGVGYVAADAVDSLTGRYDDDRHTMKIITIVYRLLHNQLRALARREANAIYKSRGPDSQLLMFNAMK